MTKRGVALIITFMVIVVLTILGSATISRTISEHFLTQRYVKSTQAFWLAEGGLAVAYRGLIENWDGYTTGLPRYDVFSQDFENGSFSVDIEDGPLPNTVKVISKGNAGAVERTLEEIIKGTVGSGLSGFDFAALAAGNLFLGGSASIQNQDVYVNGNLEVYSTDAITGGDVYAKGNATLDGGSITGNVNANGNITVKSGSTITGDATSKANVNNSGTITGTITSHATPDPVDGAALHAKVESYRLSSQDWNNYKLEAQAEGNYHAGNFYPSGSYTGIHYVEGNLIIASDISGTATFVVKGNVSFNSGNVSLDPALDSDYSFIIKGNVESITTASGTLGGVIYTEGNFKVITDITIGGAILCYGNLYGSGDFNIEFPVGETNLEILSWREL